MGIIRWMDEWGKSQRTYWPAIGHPIFTRLAPPQDKLLPNGVLWWSGQQWARQWEEKLELKRSGGRQQLWTIKNLGPTAIPQAFGIGGGESGRDRCPKLKTIWWWWIFSSALRKIAKKMSRESVKSKRGGGARRFCWTEKLLKCDSLPRRRGGKK